MDNLINPTQEAISFLHEWHNKSDYIIAHTSGSTGRPKEIKLLKKDMIASAKATCDFFKLSTESLLVCPLSASYIAGKMMIVRSIVSGATVAFEQPSATPILDNYPPITLLPIVPVQIESVLQSRQPISNIIIGGAPISSELEQTIRNHPANVFATYGMTETCSHIALRNISAGENLFRALPDVTFSLDDRNCLMIELPRFSFRQIVTNDIVELVDNKTFRWIGRYDNVIISGGLKIHPELLEKKLAPFIDKSFFITSADDRKWGQRVVICLLGEKDSDYENFLSSLFKEKLPNHEIPRELYWFNKFKTTSNGKLIRRLSEL